MGSGRVIFHIDMNCYFASVEIAENNLLKNKKIAVAHVSLDQKGIILSASYEARSCGVKTTMKVFEALKLCPDLILVEPHMELYSEYSRKFFEYFLKITPLVEPASIDEGYLDVTDVVTDNAYLSLAETIQKELLEVFNLPCSIGIGPNKFLAKMGSDMKKPLGITVIRKKDVPNILWPLSIDNMYGAGKKTCEVLNQLGIKKIGEIVSFKDQNLLKNTLGDLTYQSLYSHAMGNGENIVDPNRYNNVTSVSNSSTFDRDEYDVKRMMLLIKVLVNSVSSRLEKDNLVAKTFTLQLRYNNFKNITKSQTILQPTSSAYQMNHIIQNLFDEVYDADYAVRLIGVAATHLTKETEEIKQLSIFDSLDREEKDLELNKVLKSINETIGQNILKKGIDKTTTNDSISHFDKSYKNKR